MTVSVVGTPTLVNFSNTGSSASPASVAIANTPTAGDLIVVVVDLAALATVSSVTGLGATWAQQFYTTDNGGSASGIATHAVWFGTGATASGNITVTLSTNRWGVVRAFHVRGLTASTVNAQVVTYSTSATPSLPGNASTTNAVGPSQTADAGQFVLNVWMTTNTATTAVYPATSAPSTGWVVQTNRRDSSFGNWNTAYRIPAASDTHQLTATSPTLAGHFITQVVIGDSATAGVSGTVAATAPPATSAIAGTVVATGTVAASAPPASAAVAGTVTVTGTVAATAPSATSAVVGDVPTPVTGTVAAVAPSAAASVAGAVVITGTVTATAPAADSSMAGAGVVSGDLAATAPAASSSASGVVIATGALVATAPAATSTIVGDVTSDGTVLGDLAATAPAAGVTVAGPGAGEKIFTALAWTPDGVIDVVPLVPSTDLAESEPVLRQSHLMPPLDAAHSSFTARVDYPVTKGVVGTVHLWIGGRDVTYLRDVPTVIRRWESEAPFGDTVAAFEFPQFNPWDKPGEGDLSFLKGDARVSIGIVEEVSPGNSRVRRLWNGFLDARGNGLGEGEDYAWEAKGTFWQAQSQIREPVALTKPVDIGLQLARTLNAVEGRRWARLPMRPIGITTMTRGSRDETFWDYAQALLSEAITDDGRQWTIAEIAPGIHRLRLKPAPSEVHATVAYGTPGVDIDLRVDESTRVDRIYMRGIGPKMGGWANTFYPGLELLQPPPYPMASLTTYMVLGTTDADTVSGTGVTDWQRRVDELRSFANPAVSGVMSAAWVAVIDDLQRRVGVTADGSLGPQTWNATFDRALRGVDLTPVRLPMASKPAANKYLYSATGVNLGDNPAYDPTLVVRDIAVDVGPGKTKADGFKLARKLLGIYGTAAASGTITWTFDPNETDRTHISHLTNVKVKGFEGSDRVVQVASKSVELEAGEDGPVYVVTTQVDERARDAMAVEDLLAQRRSAQPDPSRRPGNPNKASRQVSDQRTPWDSESPCGVLRRTAVNGSSGRWTVVTIPFAEVGQLSGIRLHSDRPFAMALFASLRITENKLASIVGDPFASDDPWRNDKGQLDEYGIIESWGAKGVACGYSPKTEGDPGATFTGKFEIDTPVDYWTETVPYVSVAIFMRGGSGWISGQFIPAYET